MRQVWVDAIDPSTPLASNKRLPQMAVYREDWCGMYRAPRGHGDPALHGHDSLSGAHTSRRGSARAHEQGVAPAAVVAQIQALRHRFDQVTAVRRARRQHEDARTLSTLQPKKTIRQGDRADDQPLLLTAVALWSLQAVLRHAPRYTYHEPRARPLGRAPHDETSEQDDGRDEEAPPSERPPPSDCGDGGPHP